MKLDSERAQGVASTSASFAGRSYRCCLFLREHTVLCCHDDVFRGFPFSFAMEGGWAVGVKGGESPFAATSSWCDLGNLCYFATELTQIC